MTPPHIQPRPCPWCGSDQVAAFVDEHEGADSYHWVQCLGLTCGARGPWRFTESGAVAAWNEPADFARKP